MKRPNIVILNPDQMRADSMHHLGNAASVTPVLDRLATEGISFSRAFCQNPVCTPSRCSFMSGWYPHVAGHRTMTHMMHPWEPVLLKELKDSGYHVWMNPHPEYQVSEPYFSKIERKRLKKRILPPKDFEGKPRMEKVQNCFEDCLTNVPLIVKLPKAFQKRTGICDELAELIDFYATAADIAGLKPGHTHFGKSLVPYIKGEETKLRFEVLCEGGFRKGEEHCKERGGAKIGRASCRERV